MLIENEPIVIDDSLNLPLLDKNQKEELERLKKIQSIKSEIFSDRVLETEGRYRYFYMNEIPLNQIKIDQRIVVREKDESLLNRLKPQIESEGLIEPLTVMDMGNNQFLLIAGQHRYHVCKEVGIEKVPAKVYMNLELAEQLTLGYMSNEVRKDPPAGRKYGALNEIFHETKKKLELQLKRPVSELEVINNMYMAKIPKIAKIKIREIIIGMITDELMNNPDGLVNKYRFITASQVPKRKILYLIKGHDGEEPKFPLLTAKNAFYGLNHLVRTAAVTPQEEKDNKNFRNMERQNVKTFFDLLITKYVKPLLQSATPEVDAAMNICRRHIFETLCKLIANRLRDKGFDVQTKDGMKAPLFTDKKIPWSTILEEIEPFFKPSFLNHPNIAKERSLDMLWNRVEYFVLVKPGKMPYF